MQCNGSISGENAKHLGYSNEWNDANLSPKSVIDNKLQFMVNPFYKLKLK